MISLKTDLWRIDDIKAVIFDKDGTIIDSHIYWGRIIEKRSLMIIEKYEISINEFNELCKIMGFSLSDRRLLEYGPIALVSREKVISIVCKYLQTKEVESKEEEISAIFDQVHKDFSEEIFDYLKLLPGVLEFLLELKNHNIKTAIVTSDTAFNTELTLNHLKIFDFFDAIIGKETISEQKITGIPATEALNRLRVDGNQAICIGDAPVDLIMAEKSKCKAGIGIATGQITLRQLRQFSSFSVKSLNYLKVCKGW